MIKGFFNVNDSEKGIWGSDKVDILLPIKVSILHIHASIMFANSSDMPSPPTFMHTLPPNACMKIFGPHAQLRLSVAVVSDDEFHSQLLVTRFLKEGRGVFWPEHGYHDDQVGFLTSFLSNVENFYY